MTAAAAPRTQSATTVASNAFVATHIADARDLGRRLRAEGRLVERRRRLLTTRAQLVDAETGELLATADGLYVAAPPDRKQALKDRYRFRLVPEGDAAPAPTLDHPRDAAS